MGNAYFRNGKIEFTGNTIIGETPIETREFTQAEIDNPKIVNGKIVEDTDARDVKLLEKIKDSKVNLRNEINETTKSIILAGYQFKNKTMSCSETHQGQIESLYNRRNDGVLTFPFDYAVKDDSEMVEISDIADLEAMYLTILSHVFTAKQAGNVKKKEINAMTTIDGLENFVDDRV